MVIKSVSMLSLAILSLAVEPPKRINRKGRTNRHQPPKSGHTNTIETATFTMWSPLDKLVSNSNNYGLLYLELSFHGVYKPTYNWGGPLSVAICGFLDST